MTMKRNYKTLIIGAIVLSLAFGGWYFYKYRSCVGEITYTPAREGSEGVGTRYQKSLTTIDKGNYYTYRVMKYGSSSDAMRACIWK